MTHPVFDTSKDLPFTPDGRDIVLLWPEDGAAYAAAALRVAFNQFLGRWRYNVNAGIPYLEEILGFAPQEQVLQILFRRVALKYLPDPQVQVRQEGEEIFVRVTDELESFDTEIGLFEPAPTPTIRAEAFERQGAALRIRYSSDLRKRAVSPVEAFEVFGLDVDLLSVEILGRELLLTFSGDLSGAAFLRIAYRANASPLLQGANRAFVAPFVFEREEGYILTDLDGYILTDGDGYILQEAASFFSDDGVIL